MGSGVCSCLLRHTLSRRPWCHGCLIIVLLCSYRGCSEFRVSLVWHAKRQHAVFDFSEQCWNSFRNVLIVQETKIMTALLVWVMLPWDYSILPDTSLKLSVGFSLKSGFYHLRVVVLPLCQMVITHGLKALVISLIAVSRKCFKDSMSHTSKDLALLLEDFNEFLCRIYIMLKAICFRH